MAPTARPPYELTFTTTDDGEQCTGRDDQGHTAVQVRPTVREAKAAVVAVLDELA